VRSLDEGGEVCGGFRESIGRPSPELNKSAQREDVPQRLKPQDKPETYGTAEAVPLNETRIFGNL
jgi:hypothetical protein